jgi:hypothetical protein
MDEALTTGPNTGPSTSPAVDASDRSFDLSLRLLTALVIAALIGSLSLLAYRWLAPRFISDGASPIATQSARPAVAKPPVDADASHRDQVLMDPGRVFRCEDQGRISFSDEACTSGGNAKELPVPSRATPVPATPR